jgi:dTDP-4-dehydrorhamnose reductase
MSGGIILFGPTGQAGACLAQDLQQFGNVVACGRTEGDFAQPDSLRAFIRSKRPELIVNAAAYTSVDQAEDDEAVCMAVNASSVGVIGEEAARINARVVHFSTDYVFDGSSSIPYLETDTTGPLGVYGRSKLEGERLLAASGATHLILRTAWVISPTGRNFVKTMLRLLQERDALSVVDDQFGAPSAAAWLSAATVQIISRWRPGHSGLYHLVAAGETHWLGVARRVAETALAQGVKLRVGPRDIAPISTADYKSKARRPAYGVLDTSKVRRDFGVVVPAWQEGVDEAVKTLVSIQGGEHA